MRDEITKMTTWNCVKGYGQYNTGQTTAEKTGRTFGLLPSPNQPDQKNMEPLRMVEPKGFEPLTPTMPLWCSTN